jgi:hypothetical protein
MKCFRLAAALLLSAATCSAHAGVYHYTGNTFTFNSINPGASDHIRASFDLDVASDFTGRHFSAFSPLTTSWSMSAGKLHMAAGDVGNDLSYIFDFKNGDITGWYFNNNTVGATIQSVSHEFFDFDPHPASDIVLAYDPLRSASRYDNMGTWTRDGTVPEPTNIFLLGAGAVMLLVARRQQQQATQQ